MDICNLVSFAGLFVLMSLAWVLSKHRRRMKLRCIALGVGVQLAFGLLVFRAPGSRELFRWLNEVAVRVLTAAQAGRAFLFGPLADQRKIGESPSADTVSLVV